MGIALGLEWLLEDQVAIDMIRYHNVLVARACSDWEAAGVICVEFAYWHDSQKKVIRRHYWSGGFNDRA